MSRAALLFFALALMALTFWYARAEFITVKQIRSPAYTHLWSLVENISPSTLPASKRTQTALLQSCIRGQTDFSTTLAPLADRASLADFCAHISTVIHAQSPTDSLAYITVANAAFLQDDMTKVNEALRLSYITGKMEGWLAEYRVDLAFSLLAIGALSDANTAYLDNDIHTLLQGHRTRPYLAQTYIRKPEAKSKIQGIAEKQPPDIQRAFLASIQDENK